MAKTALITGILGQDDRIWLNYFLKRGIKSMD